MNKQEAKEIVKRDIEVQNLENEGIKLISGFEKRAELFHQAGVLRSENDKIKRIAGISTNKEQTDEYWDLIKKCCESTNEEDWDSAIDLLLSLAPEKN